MATGDFVAAGVLLVAREADDVYVLLGRDRFRSWHEMLGGRAATVPVAEAPGGSRRETAYETAIRECHEESGGYFTQVQLRRMVDSSRMIRDSAFVFYVAETDKFPVANMKSAARAHASAAFHEMADYAWVPVRNILASEDGKVVDENGRHIRMRWELKSRLERASAAGWL